MKQRPLTSVRPRYTGAARYNTNVLLVRDDVGRPKPFTRRLPDHSFSYGNPVVHDPEDAGKGKFDLLITVTQ